MAAMEPGLATAPELAGVPDELRSREPIFHHPEFGTTRADSERMTTAGFWEIGTSGHRYGRAHVLDVLEHRSRLVGQKAVAEADGGLHRSPRTAVFHSVHDRDCAWP